MVAISEEKSSFVLLYHSKAFLAFFIVFYMILDDQHPIIIFWMLLDGGPFSDR